MNRLNIYSPLRTGPHPVVLSHEGPKITTADSKHVVADNVLHWRIRIEKSANRFEMEEGLTPKVRRL